MFSKWIAGGMLLVLLGLGAVLRADVTGSIDGIVKDSSGAVAVNVEVTATNTGTNAVFHATTDSTGAYFLRGLPVGVYQLTVEPKGFKKFVANELRVQVNESLRMDITLQVGDVTQTVNVSAAAETVDTQSITLKSVVDQQRIEYLPLNGRNPTQLMQLVAGVQSDPINSNVTSGTTYPGVTPVSRASQRRRHEARRRAEAQSVWRNTRWAGADSENLQRQG